MAESSLPPPPPTNSNGLLIGFGLLAILLVGGLIVWRINAAEPESSRDASTLSAAPKENAPKVEHLAPPPPPPPAAPPPPPEEDIAPGSEQEVAEGAESTSAVAMAADNPGASNKTGGTKTSPAQGGVTPANNDGCAGTCPNRVDAALSQAVRQRGASAKNCYNAGLRSNPTLQGKVGVKVRVGPNGSTCSASIVSDTLGDASVTSCIVQKFKGGGYPKPLSGCADFEIPLSFVPSN